MIKNINDNDNNNNNNNNNNNSRGKWKFELTLETSALKLFTVANLHYQLGWYWKPKLS